MSTLAQLIDQVQALLSDDGTLFADAQVTAAMRLALADYTEALPRQVDAVITCPAAGREIALNALTGLLSVTNVWWPYDSTATSEVWPPNRVSRLELVWDDAQPVLFLSSVDQSQPQPDDEVHIWYTVPHTIQDLDSAAATTPPAPDESLLVLGASAYTLLARSADQAEDASTGAIATPNYAATAFRHLQQFRATLDKRRTDARYAGHPWASGWQLDRWDSART